LEAWVRHVMLDRKEPDLRMNFSSYKILNYRKVSGQSTPEHGRKCVSTFGYVK